MTDLHNQRRETKETEKEQSKLLFKFLNQRRETFNAADTHLWMMQNQNQVDLLEISNQVYEWKDKAKPDTPGFKILENMILALFRIDSYSRQMETVSKASVAEYISERKINALLQQEIKSKELLHLHEISKLKTQISELEKNIEKSFWK